MRNAKLIVDEVTRNADHSGTEHENEDRVEYCTRPFPAERRKQNTK